MMPRADAAIQQLAVFCYTVPTDAPEGDDTFDWHDTTLVLVEAQAGNRTGLGYSYTDPSAARLVDGALTQVVEGHDAFDVPGTHAAMLHRIRNLGRPGPAATAIAAVDNALWDLKCRLLDVSLLDLLGAARDCIGGEVELFVDANGEYDRKEALAMAERFAEVDVRWFEEPVFSDDLEGLRLLRDRGPACLLIAAG